MDGTGPESLARRVKAQDPNWTPWSEWMTVPGAGRRVAMAMPRALLVGAAVGAESIDHPTTRREQTSSTTAQETLPSRVGCSVMSVTHSWLTPSRTNRRSTRSAQTRSGRGRRHRGPPDSPQPGARHEQLHGSVPDLQPSPQRQLGVHPSGAISAAGGGVDLADDVGEDRVPNRSGGGRRVRQA
jgi:hypothetical protein